MRWWLEPAFWRGPRRALAALVSCFFALLYAVVALNLGGEWRPAMFGLSACYLTGFASLVAPWFWGRWFAAGLGWSGALVGVVSLFMLGWSWPLAIYAGLHGAIVLALMGASMATDYELQAPWRERFQMDELGVARLGKTVTRTAASLPSVVLWALGPKEPGQTVALGAGLLTVLLAGMGLRGLVRLRTWSLLAIGGALLLASGLGQLQAHHASCWLAWPSNGAAVATLPLFALASAVTRHLAPVLAAALALAIVAPSWRGLVRHWKNR